MTLKMLRTSNIVICKFDIYQTLSTDPPTTKGSLKAYITILSHYSSPKPHSCFIPSCENIQVHPEASGFQTCYRNGTKSIGILHCIKNGHSMYIRGEKRIFNTLLITVYLYK